MEEIVTVIQQFGSLGLLGYLIWWATRTLAPALLAELQAIRIAIQDNSSRLSKVEERQTKLLEKVCDG